MTPAPSISPLDVVATRESPVFKTWRDVVFDQYAADFDVDVPFPVRYLINADVWKKDIFIEIPTKIPVETLRRSVLTFVCAKRLDSDPAYRDENISVRARVSYLERQAQKANKQLDDAGSESQDPPNVAGDAQDSH
ncbi:uncharacterized protein NFIA_099220 [Aspergillus fischeri NRRL 181]|uniref:Uncharacterized protein n=1 Tax=Neosartorya fischeri (strain ATCC 1020 / DSM 3700 / CBS 544.65 / FGSC A1164 / JCM 1740 / NRRL 181 / WB 181) TaxID=331117 RepID=A1DBP8_NEOFI|nr:uncharacterized protein NFIA_099220 [Aspergillus fischeri NRRL 181]EAW20288.1 hypothetical protein NFIA_099220 [Aspergillus fischeri NRRL 181]